MYSLRVVFGRLTWTGLAMGAALSGLSVSELDLQWRGTGWQHGARWHPGPHHRHWGWLGLMDKHSLKNPGGPLLGHVTSHCKKN